MEKSTTSSDNLNDYLMCPICIDFCEEAVESSCCHQLYCKKCSALLKACSLCKKNCTYQPSIIAQRMINSLPIKCEFCNEQSNKGNIKYHLKSCKLKKYKCQICSEQFIKSAYMEHFVINHEAEFNSSFEKIYDTLTELQLEKEGSFLISKIDINKTENTGKISIGKCTNFKGRSCRLGSTGKYYCADRQDGPPCGCCDGQCGPGDGCNCSACMKLDIQNRNLPKGWLVNRNGFNATKGTTGKFYCGRKVMTHVYTTDGYCGPTNGENCTACSKLDLQALNRYKDLI